jgi:hypothetical protein
MSRIPTGLLLAWALVPRLGAAEYFIDCNAAGRPVQDGSVAHPWSELAPAVGKLVPSDVLSIRPGRYRQGRLTVGVDDVRVRKDPAVPGVVVIDGAVPLHELMNQDEQGRQKTRDNGPFFQPVITVTGNGVVLEGLEVCNGFVGISMRGVRGQVLACHVHHTGQHGIEITNHHGLVEDCVVHDANLYNVNGQCLVSALDKATGRPNQNVRKKITSTDPARNGKNMDWGQGITFHGSYLRAWAPRGCVLRGNLLWNIWGEGLACYNAAEVRMERNVAFNIWRMAYYVQNVDAATLEANLAFYDRDFRGQLGSQAMAVCYSFANEYPADHLRSAAGAEQALVPDCSDLSLINNLSYGGDYALHSGDRHKLATRGRIRLGNNLLIEPTSAACINISTLSAGPAEIRNNLLIRSGDTPVADARFLRLSGGFTADCTDNYFHQPDAATKSGIAALDRELGRVVDCANQVSNGHSLAANQAALRAYLRSVIHCFGALTSAPPATAAAENPWAGPDFFGFPASNQARVGPFARPISSLQATQPTPRP